MFNDFIWADTLIISSMLGTCAEKFEQDPTELLSEFVKSNTPAIVATVPTFLFAGFFFMPQEVLVHSCRCLQGFYLALFLA